MVKSLHNQLMIKSIYCAQRNRKRATLSSYDLEAKKGIEYYVEEV